MTVTLEVPKEQAERIEALAQKAQLPVKAMFDLMIELVSIGFDASPGGRAAVSVDDLVEALKNSDNAKVDLPPITQVKQDMADEIKKRAAEREAARKTPEGIAAETARKRARADGVGFGMYRDRPQTDGVAYQNEMRDPW